MLTKAGAKLLDFGLARSGGGLGGIKGSTELATEAKPLTTAGTVLGTFQYMAPEQLEGTEADARTDIFALGALVYEMATGRRAFEGKSKTSLIAAILSSQPPPISQVQPVMPPALDHVVSRCLEKDPDDRWQSAHDVASELRWIAEAGSQAGVPTTLALRRKSRERLAWTLAAVLAASTLVCLGWALRLRRTASESGRLLRAELVAPPDLRLADVVPGAIALSPDGQRLALVGTGGPAQRFLAIRDLASGETRTLAGTEGASFPFWSADSRSVAYFAAERLKKVEATGGPVLNLCDAHAGRGGSWSPDGTIVFAPDILGPLVKVASAGGTPSVVTQVAGAEATHRNPWFLPDGKHFLLTTRNDATATSAAIAIGSLDGGEPRPLLERGSNPQYANGFLFTVVDGTLLAQRFDPDRQALAGQPVPIAGSVAYYSPRELANFSVSHGGLLAYRQVRRRRTRPVWLDRGGKELAPAAESSYYDRLHLSADGRTLTAVRSDATGMNADAWILDLERAQSTRSTFLSAAGGDAVYVAASPDGQRLAVIASRGGSQRGSSLWIQAGSGGGAPQMLLEKTSFTVQAWSADGSLLVGETQEAQTAHDVAYLAIADPSRIAHVASSRFVEWRPALSPDGHWIAYASNETGRFEVFVCDFPAGVRKWQVSNTGGGLPAWRSDGRELYFIGPPDTAMAVDVSERGGVLQFSAPQPLKFQRDTLEFGLGVQSTDGRRFLVARYDSEAFTEPIRLIRGWRQLTEK